ncbi:restriction endonuclease subunit S [Limnobacter sp.]|uniref:restriction endonuclease subunit S n=1 Tax=Limnobacter sp. TaxID=2003368 RepID=UPI0031203943
MTEARKLIETEIQWFGATPSTWKRSALKYLGVYQNGYPFKPEDWHASGLPIIRIAQLTSNAEPNFFEGQIDERNYVQKGDLLFSWSATLDTFIWKKGPAWLNQHIFKVTPTTEADKNFLYWLLKIAAIKLSDIDAHGSTMRHIKKESLSEKVFVPSLYEQRQIAAYLSRETAKIDNLIAKQQKLIKLLQEKRQTVISQTVTKGLDPNVKMKDSGVEWLGEVPQHWNLLRGKSLFKIRKRIAGRLGFEILSITQKGIKVKDTESGGGQLSMDYSKYQLVIPGDFAMNHMDLLTGYVDISKYHGVTSPDYRVFEMKGDQDTFCSIFYKSVLQNCYHEKLFFPFGQGSSQLGRWRLPTEAFNEFVYPVPPIDEQRAIAKFIEVEISKCELLTDKANTCISLLKEHRQALITAAVTGKIDVRGLVTDEEVAALDLDHVLETTEEDLESEVTEADYITEEE